MMRPSRVRLDQLSELSERLEMLVDAPITGAHRVELDARDTHPLEGVDISLPGIRAALRSGKSSFNRHIRGITPFLAHQVSECIHSRATIFVRREMREPAVSDLCDSPQRWLGDRPLLPVTASAHPDRNGPLQR